MTEDELELEAVVVRKLNAQGWTACLFAGNDEVNARGYAPITIRNWRAGDEHDGFTFAVQFGPFRDPVEYDRYVIMDGDEPKFVIEESGWARQPPDFDWTWACSFTPDALVDGLADKAA